jgi:hypothetical protein
MAVDVAVILFLCEHDSFRFNTATTTSTTATPATATATLKSSSSQRNESIDIHKLKTLLCGLPSFLSLEDGQEFITVIQQVSDMGMHIPALYDAAIQFLWEDFVQKSQRIHMSPVWNSMKKKINDEVSIDFHTVISDDHNSVYFENFLSSDEKDVLCLQCWQNVRHIIATLQVLKIPDPRSGSRGFMHVLRKEDHPIGSGTSITHFTKPFEALDVMLECIVQYHEYIVRWGCNGVSKNTRVKVVEIMEKNKSIRGQIKSLDNEFVMELCISIEELFLTIEK